MKRTVTVILIIALCLACTACVGTPGIVRPNSEKSNTGTSDGKPSKIEETVVYDKNNIKVTVTGLEQSSAYGREIKMLIENNGSIDIVVQTDFCSVNGYMVDSSMSVNVAASKKANDRLYLMESSLSKCGINKFTNVQFNIVIADAATFDRIDISDTISLETSDTGKYTQKYDDSGAIIYEANGIKAVSRGIFPYDTIGQNLELYIENNTDKTVVIQCDNASVNGFMIDTFFSTIILPGAKDIDDMTLISSSLKENGIKEINDLEFNLVVLDYPNFDRIATSDTISLHFGKLKTAPGATNADNITENDQGKRSVSINVYA